MLSSLLASTAIVYHARNAPLHPNIHNMGNVGYGGGAHAQGAALATVIDQLAYDLLEVAEAIAAGAAGGHVLDAGCGAGTLTRELAGAPRASGLDTSPAMLTERRAVPGARCWATPSTRTASTSRGRTRPSPPSSCTRRRAAHRA